MVAAKDNTRVRPVTGRMVLFCLIGFFAVVAGVNAIMIRAAVSTFSGVEATSRYQAGQSFAREADAARVQNRLHWQVQANLRAAEGKTLVEIDARDASGRPLSGLEATALLQHPTDRRADQTVALSEDASGHFGGEAGPIVGQWDVVIELSRDGARVFRSRNRVMLR